MEESDEQAEGSARKERLSKAEEFERGREQLQFWGIRHTVLDVISWCY
ncbi:hypothetical protein P7H17_00865 [Paenibacillus larvae]|nr:hypothetical protein [Paenibacillus larvae]MDT2284947.1 hypothetical protein [Paenibacillus larvae]